MEPGHRRTDTAKVQRRDFGVTEVLMLPLPDMCELGLLTKLVSVSVSQFKNKNVM